MSVSVTVLCMVLWVVVSAWSRKADLNWPSEHLNEVDIIFDSTQLSHSV